MDETPSYMGGKGNSWRKLTLDGKLKNDFNPFPLELAQCIFTYDKHILVVIQLPFFSSQFFQDKQYFMTW